MARAATAEIPAVPLAPSERIRRFFVRQLRHAKDRWAGEPFILEPWQLDEFIEPVYDTLIPKGDVALRQVHEALLGVSRKNGKTHLEAGLGLYHLTADGFYRRDGDGWVWAPEFGAEVYNVAGSRPQAKILFQIGVDFVERSPMLRALARVYKDAIEIPETGSVWRVLAADAKLGHGYNPSAVIIDELWVHRDPGLYDAFASAGGARQQPLLISITTAGWDQASIAYKLYQRGLRGKDRRFFFLWYQAPDGAALDDTKAWRTANPSRWVTINYLRAELRRARSLGLENEFRRLHMNQWTSAREQAIPMELWRRGDGRARIPDGAQVVAAVDSAPKKDSTGIAIVHRDEAGTHHARVAKMRADPTTGYLDYDALENALREIARRYECERILVDPYNMLRSLLVLRDEGLPIEEFPQSDVRMVPASMNLYELLAQDRLRHGGSAEMRQEVQAAEKQITERGWRFTKRKSKGEIDGLTALTMATYEAERGSEEEEGPPQLFV
ncbi:MAG: terminase large subunit domain-containing protein [Actinomycetota bacterium]